MNRTVTAATAADGEALAIKAFGSTAPGPGCTFISPDGTFVNIYPKLDTHEDLCDWVEDHLGISLEYKDEEYFVREFNWIRLRSDPNMSIIMLPKDSLFRNQWYSLEDWLTYLEERYSNGCRLYLETCDGKDTDVEHNFGTEYFAEDIIKICRRYYSSGKLYMSTEVKRGMKKEIKASKLNFNFFDWYNNILTDKQQGDVDACADELGYPAYDECSDDELAKIFYRWAKTRYSSTEPRRGIASSTKVKASEEDDSIVDTYVIKIWHEVDPGHDVGGPEAAEEIITVVANSPDQALEYAKMRWQGPIDRIAIVDVNPEDDEDQPLLDERGREIVSSTAFPGSGKKREDECRKKWYTAESYPEIDAKRIEDFHKINWNDVIAEDCETFLIDEDAFPVLSAIKSVRYFDDDEQKWAEDNGYDGGYVVEFNKPAEVKYAGWRFGDSKFDDVSEEIEYAIGNKAYRDTTAENDFAALTEDNNKRIAEEAYSKKVNSATDTNSELHTSTVSFDFVHDGDYDSHGIIDAVMDILRSYGTNPLGGSFEEVDYSGYPEYANEIVSQCNVDFEWEDDYDADAIEDEIGIALLPYEVIGLQFHSAED